ncbi:hypothetical protein TrispH2_010460 [Trichoplax sp. H2]|uniref:Uncharacterized protein n=1 Tax=Trichoplax adhaerens TaxID=10228 RepID=B3RMW2_TRIAD|nr:predicted protein [Trichoplax adhaerens]EDV27919.1 predicted protein [Trichoplax adhaerens]RDD37072.1 hypothetical protein TrispH2_010460 [Trichoplax sp. H2]|eukprot:XP_002109753.1 predicted protein [Trichoplax adhaerens]
MLKTSKSVQSLSSDDEILGVNLKPYRLQYFNNAISHHGPRDSNKILQDYISDQQYDLERRMEYLLVTQRDTSDSNYYREREYFGKKRPLSRWYAHRLTRVQQQEILDGQLLKMNKSVLPPMPMSTYLMSHNQQQCQPVDEGKIKKKKLRKALTLNDLNYYVWPNYANRNNKGHFTTVKDLTSKDCESRATQSRLAPSLNGSSMTMHIKVQTPIEKMRAESRNAPSRRKTPTSKCVVNKN